MVNKETRPKQEIFQRVVTIYNRLVLEKKRNPEGISYQVAMREIVDVLANERGAVQALSRLKAEQNKHSGYL